MSAGRTQRLAKMIYYDLADCGHTISNTVKGDPSASGSAGCTDLDMLPLHTSTGERFIRSSKSDLFPSVEMTA